MLSDNYSIQNRHRYKAYVHPLGITKLYTRNPVVVALWSAIFPGMGHILLDKYLIGFALFAWEIFINLFSHLNTGIYYSFIGQIQTAKSSLNINWLLLYCPTYVFIIWDSYRTTVNMNKEYILASRDNLPVNTFAISKHCINTLEKKEPAQAAVWSMLAPGVGQMINHQVLLGLFLISIWALNVYLSRLLPAIHDTMTGMFEQAKQTVDIHWVLNIPSIYFFSIYHAYTSAFEINKLYEWEQARLLREDYSGILPPAMNDNIDNRSEDMLIVTTFDYSRSLETAMAAVEAAGIPKEHIFAVPLDKSSGNTTLLDSAHSQDGYNMFDLPMILAALFSLFGLIYGFLLSLGPILWALIGTGLGFIVGFGIKLLMSKEKRQSRKNAQVVLMIQCGSEQLKTVEDTLLAYPFLKIGTLGHAKA